MNPTVSPAATPTSPPTTTGGHCRVTVVAPTSRVDVALPEDLPLAELLPEILRLAGGPAGVFGATTWAGYALVGRSGRILDTARSLAEQGVLHGDLLRLRAVDDLPQPPVHDDVVDAVAEAVLAGGRPWTADALRIAALATVSLALGLGAVVLWLAGAHFPGSFHGRTSVIAAAAALFLIAFGIWRARYDGEPGSRGSYYSAPSHARRSWNSFSPSPSSGAHSRRSAPSRAPSHSARHSSSVTSLSSSGPSYRPHLSPGTRATSSSSSSFASRASSSISPHRTDGLRDHTVAAVLSTCAFPYAFVAGFGILPTSHWQGLGRAQFTAGALAVFVLSVATILGLGRRIVGAVAAATVGFLGLAVGVGLVATHASPMSALAVTACCCVFAIDGLPSLAMWLAGFVVEPPVSALEPGDFDGYPVNNDLVAFRTERTHDTLTGLTAGIGLVLVACVALLVVPCAALGTAPTGPHTAWSHLLGLVLAGAALCRTRLFHLRAQVIVLLTTTLATFALVVATAAAQASPASRTSWLTCLLFAAAALALPFSTPRRRATTTPTIPPRWSRAIDLAESALHLAILPVLLAVLGVYGRTRGLSG